MVSIYLHPKMDADVPKTGLIFISDMYGFTEFNKNKLCEVMKSY